MKKDEKSPENCASLYLLSVYIYIYIYIYIYMSVCRGRVSSVGRAFDCRAEGRGFDSRGRTNKQGLQITEK